METIKFYRTYHLDLFKYNVTNNDSLIIKAQVIRGISDYDAVFVEGIKFQSNSQQTKMQHGSFL